MAEAVLRGLRTSLVPLWSVWGLIAAVFLLILLLEPAHLPDHARFTAGALASTAPYILFAVLMIAGLKASGAQAIIARAFEGNQTRMIVMAALFGGLAPFCSCQVIPFIAGLLALGVPLAPVMAFWLSSPLIDPPALLITASALGWTFAISKAVGAVSLGLMGGFVTRAAISRGFFANPLRPRPSTSCSTSRFDDRPIWRFWQQAERRRVFVSVAAENIQFLLKWLTLAYILEALLIAHIPASMIGALVGGDGIGPIIVSAVVGVPAYLNSYIAPPLVAGLMEQGMSAGAAMAFMMAGAVSSVPAMAAVWSLVRLPVFAGYVVLGMVGAILSGVVFGIFV